MKHSHKNLFRVIAVAMAVVLPALALAGCGAPTGGDSDNAYTANNTEFVIGVSGPLTGGAAIYGLGVQNGAQLAVDEINANGGLNGIKFKLVALDDVNDASKVSTNYASLYEKNGMQLSLCCVTSKPAAEFIEYSNEDGVFSMAPSASSDTVPKYPNTYQMCFADGNQGKVAAEYVNEAYAGQTIGVFYKNDDIYSNGIFDQFKSNLSSDITMLETVFADGTDTDFSSQIDTLKGCKFIFMPIYYTPASLFITQAKDIMAADTVYYGCDGFDGIDDPNLWDISAIKQEVSMLSHFNSKATEGVEKEFIDKYLTKYDASTLNQFAASGYDSVYAMVSAMKKAVEDGKELDVTMSAADLCAILQDVFNNGFVFNGVTGSGKDITWDANGYVNKTAVKYTVKEAD